MTKIFTVFASGVIFAIFTYTLVPTQVLAYGPKTHENRELNLKKEDINKEGELENKRPEALKKEHINKGKHKAKGTLKK